MLTCFIDPAEIISFQAEGSAIRVNRMFINGITTEEGELEGMYFASNYAAESDERTKKRFEDVVKLKAEAINAVEDTIDEQAAIVKSVVR